MVDPSSRQAKITDIHNPTLVNLHGQGELKYMVQGELK